MDREQNKKYRIGWGMAAVIVFVAAFFDVFNAIPAVGTILAGLYWFSFGIYLWVTGHGLMNPRRLAPGLVSMAIEAFPAIQSLPALTAATIVVIVLSRMEDFSGVNILPNKKGVRAPDKKIPLNQNGMRLPRRAEGENVESGE